MRPPSEFGIDGGETNPANEVLTIDSGVIRDNKDFTRRPLDSTLSYIFDIAKAGSAPSAAVDAKILSDEVTTLLQTNANTQYHEFYDPFIATPEAGVNFYSVDSTSGTNVYFRRRCGYRPCPSWSEWRSAYEKGTWGYDGAAETTYTYNLVKLLPEAGGASPFEGKRTGYAEMLGCKTDGTSPVSNWKRECREFGEDGGEMKMTCSGSSRDIRQDCPIWTHWSLNINTCGYESGGSARLKKPHCNCGTGGCDNACGSRPEDYYFEYRKCVLGGIDNAKNPRDGLDFNKDFIPANVWGRDYGGDHSGVHPGSMDNNKYCRTDGSANFDSNLVNKIGYDVRSKQRVKCGITGWYFWECCDYQKWLILEITIFALFVVALALIVLLHALIPIHFLPFFGR